MKHLFLIVFILLFCTLANAQKFNFRPEIGMGGLLDNKKWVFSQNYGATFLISANDKQFYGLRSSYLTYEIDKKVKRYVNVGLVLEMLLIKYFNVGIGSMGFIDLTKERRSLFGIYTHLGFQYRFHKNLSILVSYQTDFIFRNSFAINNTLKTGVGIYF